MRLKRRLMVAFEYSTPDERTLTESIYRQRAEAWQGALTEQARTLGSGRQGKAPSGGDQRYLLGESRKDAASIRQTFNRDLGRQIEKLYAANPDGNRQYYVDALTQWADERAAWKDYQITLYNNKTARHYAQQRFRQENATRAARYRAKGPAPVCNDCAAAFAAGVVGQAFVNANPFPFHPGCPHEWQIIEMGAWVALDELWVG
jgi:hypothetical protein